MSRMIKRVMVLLVLYLINFLLARLECRKGKHVFRGIDLIPRDESGMVSWPCARCHKSFRAECGLSLMDEGEIVGPWGER